jgi:hypothetical protein
MKSLVQSRAQRGNPIAVRDIEVLLYLKSRAQRGTSIAKKAFEVQS